jgi:hypothetical protein
MSRKVKVTGNDSLERDTFSGAILNCDTTAYNYAVNRKKNIIENKKTIEDLKEQVEELLKWKNEIINILNKKDINSNSDG